MQLQGRPTSSVCVNKVLTIGLFCSANNRKTALITGTWQIHWKLFLSANKHLSLQLEDPLNSKYFYKKTEQWKYNVGKIDKKKKKRK